jgi:hypothetical protein
MVEFHEAFHKIYSQEPKHHILKNMLHAIKLKEPNKEQFQQSSALNSSMQIKFA